MPVKVRKRRGRFRIVEADTGRIVTSSLGNASDGGGHRTRAKAERQARAINAAYSRKKRTKRT